MGLCKEPVLYPARSHYNQREEGEMKIDFRHLALGTKFVLVIVSCSAIGSVSLWAANESSVAQDQLNQAKEKEVTVTAVKPEENVPFLPDVQGTKIHAG